MGLSAKTDKDFFELCNKYLENTDWEEIIAQYRPFCNFLWYFGAKNYYNLHDDISVFSDLEQYFSNTVSKFHGILRQNMINTLPMTLHKKWSFPLRNP